MLTRRFFFKNGFNVLDLALLLCSWPVYINSDWDVGARPGRVRFRARARASMRVVYTETAGL